MTYDNLWVASEPLTRLEEKFDALVKWLDKIKHKIPLYHILDDWLWVRMGLPSNLSFIKYVAQVAPFSKGESQ